MLKKCCQKYLPSKQTKLDSVSPGEIHKEYNDLVKEIENLSDEEVTQLNLPNAIPFVYELDPSTLKPLQAKRFLADEATVKKAVTKVASIGTKK